MQPFDDGRARDAQLSGDGAVAGVGVRRGVFADEVGLWLSSITLAPVVIVDVSNGPRALKVLRLRSPVPLVFRQLDSRTPLYAVAGELVDDGVVVRLDGRERVFLGEMVVLALGQVLERRHERERIGLELLVRDTALLRIGREHVQAPVAVVVGGLRLDLAEPPVVQVALAGPAAGGLALDDARLVPLRPELLGALDGRTPGGAHELDELGAVLAAADPGVSQQVVEAASPGFPVLAVVDERHGLVLVLNLRSRGLAIELRGSAGHPEGLVDALVLDVLERRDGIAPNVVSEHRLDLLHERHDARDQRNRLVKDVVEVEARTRVHEEGRLGEGHPFVRGKLRVVAVAELLQHVLQLLHADTVEVDRESMQEPGVFGNAALAEKRHGRAEDGLVLPVRVDDALHHAVKVVGQRKPLDHGDVALAARLGLDRLGPVGDLDGDAVGMAAAPLAPRDLLAAGLQKALGEDGPPKIVRADPFPGRIVGQKDVVLLDVGMALVCPPGVIMLRFLPAICH